MHGYGDVFTDEEIERNADITPARARLGRAGRASSMSTTRWSSPDSALGYALITIENWPVVEPDATTPC